jgi:hypothetical protein
MTDGRWIKGGNGYCWENAKLAKYHRDWCAGKVQIPGLKVSIKDVHGNEYGPSTCKFKEFKDRHGDYHVLPDTVVFSPTRAN